MKSLVFFSILALVFALSIVTINDAHADTLINDETSCLSIPGAEWTSSPAICTLTQTQTVGLGESWTIDNSIILWTSATLNISGTINVNQGSYLATAICGTLNNYGTINNYGGLVNQCYFNNYGTINNYGNLGNGIEFSNFGLINNSGTLTNSSTMTNSGVIDNSGTIVLNNSNGLTNNVDGTITNDGTIENSTKLENFGTVYNNNTINSQYGLLDNSGTFVNNGSINGGTLNNLGEFSNIDLLSNFNIINSDSGTFSNEGTITNEEYNTISNYATMVNSGTINIKNPNPISLGLVNNSGGVITNSGTITFDTPTNLSIITVQNNSGGIINNSNTININPDAIVNNSGTINNNGTIDNDGIINNLCGAVYDGIDPIGTGVINYLSCLPTVSINDISLNEGNSGTTNFIFTVTRSSGTGTSVVDYATSDGTATVSDSDYVAKSNQLSFANGETSKTITISVNGNSKFEADETFNVNLSNCDGCTIGDGLGIGTILNDDAGLSINDVSLAEGNSGNTAFVFTVTRSGNTAGISSAQFSESYGTATRSDFSPYSNTVTFASGEITKTITIYVSGDTAIEPDETFSIGLLNCVNCSFIKPNGIATILNDDYPKLSINNVSITEGNSGTKNLVFTVTRASYSGTSSVTYATSDGTAKVSDSDYSQVSNTLVFTGNQLQKTFSIPILGDTKYEPDETFNVSLSNCVGCTLPNNSGIGTITNDDKKK